MRPSRRWGAGALLLLLGACVPRTPGPAPAPSGPVAPGLPRTMPEVRVGLLVDTTRVAISSTTGMELSGGPGGAPLARIAAGQTATVTAAAGALSYSAAGGAVTSAASLVATATGGGTLSVNGRPYRGTVLVRPSTPGRLTVVNTLDLESYLLGVVPQEIGRVGVELLEAAKAQAVAARTYAVKYLGRRSALGFDVYATVQDQVYGGLGAETDPVSRAVRETAGQILVYRGEPIEAYYHSTCAGQTAAIDEVWPQEAPRPYLVSVVDVDPRTGEAFDRSSSRFRWTQRWSADTLTRILNRTLADSVPAGGGATVRARGGIGQLRDLRVLERTQSGRVRRLLVSTTAGDFYVGGDRVRWVFLTPQGAILNSSRFDVQLARDARGRVTEVVADGGGWGHGIGMCQVGAMGRARAGQDYRTILGAYYPGAQIADLY